MAKEQTDRITLDLFTDERRPGRPKTNPLPREAQLRINKRNQLRRDKGRGLQRIELKLSAERAAALDRQAAQQGMTRSALLAHIVQQWLEDSASGSA